MGKGGTVSSEAVRLASDDDLYRRMKCTTVGTMLQVRLHADLATESVLRLRRFRDLRPQVDPVPDLHHNSRLAETVSWLVKKFGRTNALRAIRDTAREILETVPGN